MSMLNKSEILDFEFTHIEVLDRFPIHEIMAVASPYQYVIVSLFSPDERSWFSKKNADRVLGSIYTGSRPILLQVIKVLLFNDLVIEVRKSHMSSRIRKLKSFLICYHCFPEYWKGLSNLETLTVSATSQISLTCASD